MPRDNRPAGQQEDIPQGWRNPIQRMIDAAIERVKRGVRNREIWAKHADSHLEGGFDPINLTGANTDGPGIRGLWPQMKEAVDVTISSGTITLTAGQDQYIIAGGGATSAAAATIGLVTDGADFWKYTIGTDSWAQSADNISSTSTSGATDWLRAWNYGNDEVLFAIHRLSDASTAAAYPGLLIRSDDGGTTWDVAYSGALTGDAAEAYGVTHYDIAPNGDVYVVVAPEDGEYADANDTYPLRIYRSPAALKGVPGSYDLIYTDTGYTEVSPAEADRAVKPIQFAVLTSRMIIYLHDGANDSPKAIRGTKTGSTWSFAQVAWDPPGIADVDDTMHRVNSERLLFADDSAGDIYKSDDFGENWTIVSNQSVSAQVAWWKESWGDKCFFTSNGNVYRSSDNGDNWTLVDTRAYQVVALDYSPQLDKLFLSGTADTNHHIVSTPFGTPSVVQESNASATDSVGFHSIGVFMGEVSATEAAAEFVLHTITGYPENRFAVLRVDAGFSDVITVTQDGNIVPIFNGMYDAATTDYNLYLDFEDEWLLTFYNPDLDKWIMVQFADHNPYINRRFDSAGGNLVADFLSAAVRFGAASSTLDTDGILALTSENANVVKVDTFGAASSDNLDGISRYATTGAVTDGDWLILQPAADARTVVIRHNQTVTSPAKKIITPSAASITMDDMKDIVIAKYNSSADSAAGAWEIVAGNVVGTMADPWRIIDADADTYVRTESAFGADEDVIESASGGTIRSRLSALGLQLANGTDYEMYSDAFSTKMVHWDGATGHLMINDGGGASAAATDGLIINTNFSDPSGSTTSLYSQPSIQLNASNANSIYSWRSAMGVVGGAAGTFTQSGVIRAVAPVVTITKGSATTLAASDVRLIDLNATVSGSGATITDLYHVRINNALEITSGSVGTQYGLYIASMAAGTTNRAIHSLGGISTHLGAMRFGSNSAPTNGSSSDGILTAGGLFIPDATAIHSAQVQFSGPVVISSDGTLLFSDNTNYVGLQAPATPQTENYIYQLPDDDPVDGQVLAVKSTAGSPTISTEWITPTAGTGGHTIRENGVDQTARTGLNFIDADAGAGLITDDAGGDETEVNLSLYRLESQDHSHASTGLQGGVVDASVITYTPASAEDFAGDPGDTDQALDVLAARTAIGREYVRAEMMVPRVTSPAPPAQRIDSGDQDVTYRGIPFDASSDEYATYVFALPANYAASANTPWGSTAGALNARFYWTSLTGTGDVVWGIRMSSLRNDDAINTALGTAVTVTDTRLADGDVHITSYVGEITPSGTLAADNLLFCEFYRDADNGSDTKTGDAYLIGVEILWPVSAGGYA